MISSSGDPVDQAHGSRIHIADYQEAITNVVPEPTSILLLASAAALREHLEAYVELLRQHIDKEDNVLYVMADQVLTADDQRELAEAFERIEAEEMGEGVHAQYHKLAHELAEV